MTPMNTDHGRGAAAFRVQNQVRRNAQELQENLADLGRWEKSIKKRDKQLSRKAALAATNQKADQTATTTATTPPVRCHGGIVAVSNGPPLIDPTTTGNSDGHHKGLPQNDDSAPSSSVPTDTCPTSRGPSGDVTGTAARTASEKAMSAAGHTYDKGYGKWDKFDIDAALREVDESGGISKERADSSDEDEGKLVKAVTSVTGRSPRRNLATTVVGSTPVSRPAPTIPRATITGPRDLEKEERERGNKMFSKGDFEGAVKCYTRCVGMKSTSALAFSNRAMAYLKLKEFVKAEADSDAALRVEPRHVKSLQRRAVARNALGKHRAALADLQYAAQIDPGSKEIRKDISKTLETLKAVIRRAPKQRVKVESEDFPAPRPRNAIPPRISSEAARKYPTYPGSTVDFVELVEGTGSSIACGAPTNKAAPVYRVAKNEDEELSNANGVQHQRHGLRTTVDELPDSVAESESVESTESSSPGAAARNSVVATMVPESPRNPVTTDVDADSHKDRGTPAPLAVSEGGGSISTTANSPCSAAELAEVERTDVALTVVDSAVMTEEVHLGRHHGPEELAPPASPTAENDQSHPPRDRTQGAMRAPDARGTGIDSSANLQVASGMETSAAAPPAMFVSTHQPHPAPPPRPSVYRARYDGELPVSAARSTSRTKDSVGKKSTKLKAREITDQATKRAVSTSASSSASRQLPTTGYQLEHMWRSASVSSADPDAALELLRAVPPSSIVKIFRHTPLEVELLEGILEHLSEAFLPERPATALRWLKSLSKASRFAMAASLMGESGGRRAARGLIEQLEASSSKAEELESLRKQYML